MLKRNISISNSCHSKLADLNRKKLYSSKSETEYELYRVREAYHREVMRCQSHIGRVLTKSERKKAYAIEKKHCGLADLRGLFTK